MSTNLICKSITHLHQLLLFCVIFQWINHVNGIYMSRRFPERSRIPCEDPEPLPNGFSVAKRHNMLLQHYCNYGFKLIGDRRTQCNRGKWNGDRPVCAKSGCTIPSENPEHGRIQYIDQYHIGTYCTEGYDLAGNRYAYCNGTDWDRPLGSCRLHSGKVSHECDFETIDICGWVIDTISEGFKWRRAMAANVFTSFHTGPRHDHTTMKASGGHYMLMESFGATVTPAALTSPIYGREISLKTACCFQFYYFMYGAGVGNLNVYVKPVSKMLTDVMEDKEYVKFTKSGNQNSKWNEAHFTIDEMEDDFQIVFVADGAKNHLSDIAIDDVRILTGTECKSLDNHSEEPDDSAEVEPTTTEESLYDTLSCVSRCSQEANIGIMRDSSRLFGLCSCHDSCIVDDDCCPDYVKVCLDAPNDDPNSTAITPTTVTTTTTTTPKPTTNSTTTETTTNTTPVSRSITFDNTTTTRKTTSTTKMTTPTTTISITTTTVKSHYPIITPVTSMTTTERRRPIGTTGEVITTTTTPPKTLPTTKATTTRKPTITTTKRTTPKTTTKRTTPAAKRPTLTTKKTTTTTTTTTTVKPTTTTTTTTATASTKRSTTFSTTTLTSTKIPINTQPIFEVTTGAVIERETVKGDTRELPRKEKNQSPKNATKHTWQWQPKPESNPRGTLALLFVFGLLLTVIIASAVYRQRSTLKTLLLGKILQKGQHDDGAEDSNSIIANFRQEDPKPNGTNSSIASGSSGGNRLRISLPSLKRGKQEKRNSAEEELYCADDENDDIPLL